jgi:hypothetical protein
MCVRKGKEKKEKKKGERIGILLADAKKLSPSKLGHLLNL